MNFTNEKNICFPIPPADKSGWPWYISSSIKNKIKKDYWPKISIITPSYNQGQFIEETIRSVLLQRYPNLEYIIIDGGSTDCTLDIIRKYGPWISYWVSEPDNGQSHALNKGFAVATGDIFGWINSDDTYNENALKFVGKWFSENPLLEYLYGGIYVIDENSKIIDGYRPLPVDMNYYLRYGMDIRQQGFFWTKKLHKKIGKIDETYKFAMDLDFLYRLLSKGNGDRIDAFLGNFRIQHNSKSTLINSICIRETKLILYKYKEELNSSILTKSRIFLRIRKIFYTLIFTGLKYPLYKLLKKILNIQPPTNWLGVPINKYIS